MSLIKSHEKIIVFMGRKIDQGYPLFENGLQLRNKINDPADSQIAAIVMILNITDEVLQL